MLMKLSNVIHRLLGLAGASAVAIIAVSVNAGAQQPTPAQAQVLLANPSLANQACERLRASGMTAEQVRARLTAGGYPQALFDSCLAGGTTNPPPSDAASQQAAL